MHRGGRGLSCRPLPYNKYKCNFCTHLFIGFLLLFVIGLLLDCCHVIPVGVVGGQGPWPGPAWGLGKAPCSQKCNQICRQDTDRSPDMHPIPQTWTPHTCKQPFPKHAPNSAYMQTTVPQTCTQFRIHIYIAYLCMN